MFQPNGIVTFTTDFGRDDAYVGAMYGVVLSTASSLRIADISHGVPPQDVLRGAVIMRGACTYFPAGTVHVGVVDPGVGTLRAEIVVLAGGHAFVGPDNGLFELAIRRLGGAKKAWRIDVQRLLGKPASNTFHGRDVFTPIGASIAAGLMPPDSVGTPIEPTRLDVPAPRRDESTVEGQVLYADRFGNLVTNIDQRLLASLGPAPRLRVWVPGADELRVATTYAAVNRGELLALVGSEGALEVAVREGSAAGRLAASSGDPVRVTCVSA